MSDNSTDLDGADKVVAQSPRNGFETRFRLDKILDYARVAALDAEGNIIGSTSAVETSGGEVVDLDYNITDVTVAGSNSIDKAVPSSASVTVPTGSGTTDVSAGPKTYVPKPQLIGGIVAGVVICVVAVV